MKMEWIAAAVASTVLAIVMSAGAMAAEVGGQHADDVLYGINGPQYGQNTAPVVARETTTAAGQYRSVSSPLYGISGPRYGANAAPAVAAANAVATPAELQSSGPLYGINGPRYGRNVPQRW